MSDSKTQEQIKQINDNIISGDFVNYPKLKIKHMTVFNRSMCLILRLKR